MRIGIDARTILNPEKEDSIGVGHYTYQLIRHLLEIDKKNEYVIFFDFRAREKDVKKFQRDNSKVVFFPFSDYKKYMRGFYDEILENAAIQREKLDVFHSPDPRSKIPFGYKGKTVVTFHDLGVYKLSQCYPRFRRIKEKAKYSLASKRAGKIISVSESTKQDLMNVLKVKEGKIDVVRSGLDKRFFEYIGNTEKVKGKFGIKKKYILFLGTLEPSKNISGLLRAFASFKKKYVAGKKNGKKFDYQLVLAGKRGWRAHEYVEEAKKLGIFKDIVFTGYIIGDEIVPLFRGSEFFVLPSLHEGFGTTVLEAFATETPAIVSNVSSLPEITDGAARLIDPSSVDEIAKALWDFSRDEGMRNEYAKKGLKQAKV